MTRLLSMGRMSRFFLVLVFFTLAMSCLPVWAEYPGVTPGRFSVSDSGAANYTLPISVPAGVAGMSPELAVTYNSQGGNGLMGVGFGLSGMSASIHRCGASHIVDGKATGVKYDDTDMLCMNGQRLIRVSGTHWRNGTVYRPEVDTFDKVVYRTGTTSTGEATDYFDVYTRDGEIHTYSWRVGVSSEGLLPRRNVSSWLKHVEQDRAGNRIHYRYKSTVEGDGERFLPDEIIWGAKNLSEGNRKVVFEYRTRPDRRVSYLRGIKSESKHLLWRIKTYIDDTLVKEYRFSYQTSPVSGLSRLMSTQQCGADGGCLPGHALTWQDTRQGFDASTAQAIAYQLPVPLYDYEILGNSVSGDGNAEFQTGDFVDVNNDGYVDFIESYRRPDGYSVKRLWQNTGTGWVNIGAALDFPVRDYHMISTQPILLEVVQQAHYVDVNGDGYVDIVRAYKRAGSSVQEVWLNDQSGFNWTKSLTFVPPTVINNYDHLDNGRGIQQGHLVDVNGDGLVDWVRSYLSKSGTEYRSTWVNNGVRWIPNEPYKLPAEAYLDDYRSAQNVQLSVKRTEFEDLNGDGLVDLIQAMVSPDTGLESGKPYRQVWLNSGDTSSGSPWVESSDYLLPDYITDYTRLNVIRSDGSYGPNLGQRRGDFIDVNGDGLVDWVRAYLDAQDRQAYRSTWLNTGKGWVFDGDYELKGPVIRDYLSNSALQTTGTFMDINRDGLVDWLVSYISRSGEGYQRAYLNTGSGWQRDDAYHLPNYLINMKINKKNLPMRYGVLLDINGDGSTDYLRAVNTRSGTSIIYTHLGHAKPADMVETITDSLQAVTTITYKSMMDDSVYAVGSGPFSYRHQKVYGPNPIVSQTRQSNGVGGEYLLQYFYYYARGDGKRGYQGFAQRRVWDPVRKLLSVKDLYQEFPATGMLKREQVYRADAVTSSGGLSGSYQLLSQSVNFIKRKSTFAEQGSVENVDQLVHPSGKTTYAPRIRRTRHLAYEWGQPTPIRSVWTETYYDAYVNPATVRVVTLPGAGAAYESLTLADHFYTYTHTTYQNTPGTWLIGLPTNVKVTHHVPGVSNQTRETQTTYNALGLPIQIMIEPHRAEFRLTTTHGYDEFGNEIRNLVQGQGLENRLSTTQYDSRGLHAIQKTNALGHVASTTPDPICDAPASSTDVNGLVTRLTYDQFCRVIRTDHADGTWATTGFGYTPLRTTQRGTNQPNVITYYDRLGRQIKTEMEGFEEGQTVVTEKQYNGKGQLRQASLPYYPGDTVYWTRYYYDGIGRLYQTRSPDSSITRVEYNGLTTTTTNAKGQTQTQIKDIIGRLKTVLDAQGNAIHYSYDALGHLLKTTDPEGNEVKMGYDHAGRKIWMDDPDMGLWRYDYDVLGQLIEQTDAKDQVIRTSYDKLGRLTERVVQPDTPDAQVSTWTYDSANKGIGKLDITTGPNGYQRRHTYDALGRPRYTYETIDGLQMASYQQYNAHGKLAEIRYPGRTVPGVPGYLDRIQFRYTSKGYLQTIQTPIEPGGGATATHETLWVAEAMDAKGNITHERYGNGVSVARTYHPTRNFLRQINSHLGSTPIQDLTYWMDEMGNLTLRRDAIHGGYENFYYDTLNRLIQSKTTPPASAGQQYIVDYEYDVLGNLRYRSDVGTMNYGENGYGPHAITSVQQTQSVNVTENVFNPYGAYHYDGNGNLTSNGQRTVDWTAFNKPKQMASVVDGEARGVSYTYGSDFQRISKTTLGGKSTRYYGGGSMEYLTEGDDKHWKYYIPVGAATLEIKYEQVGENLSASTYTQVEKQYLFKDHLGSTDVIVDDAGVIIERLSFNAWGERRDSDWSEADGEITSVSNRGYTGHEMDDEVGLVNMNARIYDPIIGRFLSPDALIPSPTDLQSYNRYSYVRNNPLSFTDPSGHVRVPGGGCGQFCTYHYEGGSFYQVTSAKPCQWAGECKGVGAEQSVVTKRVKITDPGLIRHLSLRIGVVNELIENYGGVHRGTAKNLRDDHRAQAAAELEKNGKTAKYQHHLDTAYAANEIYKWLKRKARKRYTRTAFKLAASIIAGQGLLGLAESGAVVAGTLDAAVLNATATVVLSEGDLKQALVAAATAGVVAPNLLADLEGIQAIAAHGVWGGISAEITGGGFAAGFAGAAVGKSISLGTDKYFPDISNSAEFALTVAGAALTAELAGGDPAMAALHAGVSYLYNHAASAAEPEGTYGPVDTSNCDASCTIEATSYIAGGAGLGKVGLRGAGYFLGPRGPVFGNSFYRGAGNSGFLNHGHVRLGWSYNKGTNRLNFSLRVGGWHSDKYFNPISIKPN